MNRNRIQKNYEDHWIDEIIVDLPGLMICRSDKVIFFRIEHLGTERNRKLDRGYFNTLLEEIRDMNPEETLDYLKNCYYSNKLKCEK